MKWRVLVFLSAALAAASAATAQSPKNGEWLGVWQGQLDGQPSVVLTLADDTGTLGGTLVLNIIQKQDGKARIVATEPHTLINPRVDPQHLAFQFRKRDGSLADFTVKRTAGGHASIHCSNCGADAPTVDIVETY